MKLFPNFTRHHLITHTNHLFCCLHKCVCVLFLFLFFFCQIAFLNYLLTIHNKVSNLREVFENIFGPFTGPERLLPSITVLSLIGNIRQSSGDQFVRVTPKSIDARNTRKLQLGHLKFVITFSIFWPIKAKTSDKDLDLNFKTNCASFLYR